MCSTRSSDYDLLPCLLLPARLLPPMQNLPLPVLMVTVSSPQNSNLGREGTPPECLPVTFRLKFRRLYYLIGRKRE